MNKTIYVLGLAIAFIGCKQEPVDYALISGTITNKTEDFKILTLDKSVDYTLNIENDGSFSDTLRMASGSYILYDGTNRAAIYIEKGDHIKISADASNFNNTLTFSGKGSEESLYLLAKEQKELAVMGDRKSFYSLEELEFKKNVNQLESSLQKMFDSTIGVAEDFKSVEKKNLHYANLNVLKNYESYHASFTQKPDFKVSNDFSPELKNLSYDIAEDYQASTVYKNMVNSHYMAVVSKHIQEDSMNITEAFFKSVESIPNENIRNSFLFDNSKTFITLIDDVDVFFNLFKNSSTNQDHINEIKLSYTELKKVANGQPSPKFVNYENYAGGTTSLDDLKGKYVYIDVWATWCGPCMAEIPFLQKIEKAYHGKNIEFVSLSVDKPNAYEKWKDMIKEKQLGGIQLLADKNFESQFIQDYLIKGIPRFILIDPYGNIVNSNAPRPSNEDLINLFNELNI